jgi:hypothetical protein
MSEKSRPLGERPVLCDSSFRRSTVCDRHGFRLLSLKESVMSLMLPSEEKVQLPRRGGDEFWEWIGNRYAGDDAGRWRLIAMLTLREVGNWSTEQIGLAFGHPRGTISRCLQRVKTELRGVLSPTEVQARRDLLRCDPDECGPHPGEHANSDW